MPARPVTPFLHALVAHCSARPDSPDMAWEALARQVSVNQLTRGMPLLSAGMRWTDIYWLECGACRLFYATEDGLESNKNFYVQGALFWPITRRLQRVPVQFHIEALSTSRVWRLPWSAWHAMVGQDPVWLAYERDVLENLLDDKMQREQGFLQLSATERYLRLASLHPQWLQDVPLRHLASYIGITDVAVSRIRRKLRLQGLNPG